MKLVSTRDTSQNVNLSEALLNPSASSGALFAPLNLPILDEKFFLDSLNLSYQDLALAIIKQFDFDLDLEIFKKAVKTYDKFDDLASPVKIAKFDLNLYINELYHGPTRAFKDMALQPFGEILNALAKKRDENYLIICATSGDTGPATLESFKNSENIKVVCIYPANATSEVQRLQMVNVDATNLKTIGIIGNFDDAQRTLKELLSDDEFKKELLNKKLKLSAANSVNFGRILFQIIYYVYTYIYFLKNYILKDGESFDAIVPSGNFGNALGAYYAKKMGVKIRKIKISSNENNILTELFTTGIYDLKNKSLVNTISPAMDILISSNVERLLFDKFGDKRTKELMENLNNDKFYALSKDELACLQEDFEAQFCSDAECKEFIKKAAQKSILIDPHTATCFKLVDKSKLSVIFSTAHWVKFTPSMFQSIKEKGEFSEKDAMFALAKEFNDTVPDSISRLFEIKEIHTDIIDKKDIKNTILRWLE